MKKRVITSLCVLLVAVLLFPITYHLKDGGTVVYKAVLYVERRIAARHNVRLNPIF